MGRIMTVVGPVLLLLASAGCTGHREVRPLMAEWDGDTQRIVGSIDIAQFSANGRVWLSHPNQEDLCEGSYRVGAGLRGTWSLQCTNGDTAAGVLQAYGAGRGSSGSGMDSQGRRIRYTIGPEPGTRQPSRVAPAASVFEGVAPSSGEPIPIAAVEALFRYCVASNPAGLPPSTTAREYCHCMAREIRANFSYQGFMTLIGEVVAARRASGEKRLAMHPQIGPLTRRCVSSGPSPMPAFVR